MGDAIKDRRSMSADNGLPMMHLVMDTLPPAATGAMFGGMNPNNARPGENSAYSGHLVAVGEDNFYHSVQIIRLVPYDTDDVAIV
jgi:hypothetical protein